MVMEDRRNNKKNKLKYILGILVIISLVVNVAITTKEKNLKEEQTNFQNK